MWDDLGRWVAELVKTWGTDPCSTVRRDTPARLASAQRHALPSVAIRACFTAVALQLIAIWTDRRYLDMALLRAAAKLSNAA